MTTEEFLNNVREKLGYDMTLFECFKRALPMVLNALTDHISQETKLEDVILEKRHAQLFYDYCLGTLFQVAIYCYGDNEEAFGEADTIANLVCVVLDENQLFFGGLNERTITPANCDCISPCNDIIRITKTVVG